MNQQESMMGQQYAQTLGIAPSYTELMQQLQEEKAKNLSMHVRVKQAESAEGECERYAGEMESALEAIRSVCGIVGTHSDSWGEDSLRDMIRTIGQLARVKDTRGLGQLAF